ncbi:hypothetical protein SAMN05421837_110163 [Amycolatopsis pretoriensis]|uniref:Uncharacterized protein n=1 Tax=Amycolatopsis pretoriensis TaxID=218821 RepID=A0A1H5RFG4_9PSEU|nr:hypothetical protein [Amycolatopsis pretoriensis]SEF36408.1 hypothetical protein SAMN05421837_110163 [Amycolatopsis pretoriensis]
MRIRKILLVIPLLVLDLVACGRPVTGVKVGKAVPVPSSIGVPACTWLGDTPVAPEVVRL